MFTFDAFGRGPARSGEVPAGPITGGTAAGSVGVAVPLAWVLASAGLACAAAGCASARQSTYFPESMTITSAFGHDDHGGWDRETLGANFTWRLKPLRVAPVLPATNPETSNLP